MSDLVLLVRLMTVGYYVLSMAGEQHTIGHQVDKKIAN